MENPGERYTGIFCIILASFFLRLKLFQNEPWKILWKEQTNTVDELWLDPGKKQPWDNLRELGKSEYGQNTRWNYGVTAGLTMVVWFCRRMSLLLEDEGKSATHVEDSTVAH